jgi:predicted PP-loop superfamily ATPase
MYNIQMRICSNCILPETFPGISFNDDGVCCHCWNLQNKEMKRIEDKKIYEQKFLHLLAQLGDSRSEHPYDILMAYSGGKDSTYTMFLLRQKYGLRILAVSFDNGFISETARSNIQKITEKLGIDHIFFKPQWEILKKMFSVAASQELYSMKSLERASTICTSCMGLVKSICLRMAVEQGIPMIGYGWSPGQAPVQSSIMKTNPSLIRMSQQTILDPLKKVVGNDIKVYFLQERHYAFPERFPYNIHPLAWEFYHEATLLQEIQKLGWVSPTDTDSNSSNCLLNAFANEIHIQKYGYSPYVWEIANLVRDGLMSRVDGYKKIYQESSLETINIGREKLGL